MCSIISCTRKFLVASTQYSNSMHYIYVIYVGMLLVTVWGLRRTYLLVIVLMKIKWNYLPYACRKDSMVLSSLTTYYRTYYQINSASATNGTGTAYTSGAPEFTPGFQWDSCYSIFSFICMFCRSLFVLLYFSFWPLCFLFFFDIQILIAPLVSSNSSLYQKPYAL